MNSPDMQEPPQSGQHLRDQGIAQVDASQHAEWKNTYRYFAENFLRITPAGTWFIGEDLRVHLKSKGLQEPSHPNAWGAMANGVMRRWRSSGRVTVGPPAHTALAAAHHRLSQGYIRTNVP